MPTLPVTLDRSAPGPLGVQLSGRIRALVVGGTLERGDRLPSTRALATDLGVSRAVTEQAYEQLLAEGWLEARRGSGTYVAATGAAPARVTRRRTAPAPSALVRLDAGTPWIDPRHAAGWRRAWREVSTAHPPRGYADPRGLPELRALLADRLARTRGLSVDPDEVVVTSGTTDGLRHLLTVLPPGPVALEDPGYRAAVETVRGLGREVRDARPRWRRSPTSPGSPPATSRPPTSTRSAGSSPVPTWVSPLGAAHGADAVVVEDDYDSEFRYDVAPVPALASLDREQVAYLGTAAKSVAPSLRLGWLVPPPGVLDRLNARRLVTHEGAPWPVQRAFLALLRDGYVDQVVRTARRVYADRAPRVAAALAPYAALVGPVAGMYSTWLLPQADALRARTSARDAGFEVNLLSDYARSSDLTGLVVGFGGVTDDELDRALAALVSGLGSRLGSGPG